MNIRHFKDNSLICLVSLFTFLLTQPAIAATPKNSDLVSGNNTLENSETVRQSASPGHDFNQPVERMVIELSDDQVRRMLIEELRKQAQQTAAVAPKEKKLGGLASLIKKIRFIDDTIKWRIYSLKSGFEDKPDKLPHFFHLFTKGEAQKKQNPLRAIFSVIGLFVAGLMVFWFVHRLLSAIYRRIERNRSSDLKLKIVGSGLRSMLDFIAICIFAIVTLALFYTAMERTDAQSLLSLTYLTAFLIVMGARLVLRFFFVTRKPRASVFAP
jgi:hypothetical protein